MPSRPGDEPMLTTTLTRHQTADTSAAIPEAPLRVLCVDDNIDAADSLGQILRLYGADVTVCHGGYEALDAVSHFEPDVAVLDVTMPGMDGCELAHRLREKFGSRPLLIAALTALDGYTELSREVDSGFDLHFTKPVAPGELIDALAEYGRRS